MLAKAGTSVVRLLKLVRAFCSIVSGCSRAPSRWVWAFHSCDAGELVGEMRLPEGDVADAADAEDDVQLGSLRLSARRSGRRSAAAGRRVANQRFSGGTVSAPERPVEGSLHRVLEGAGMVGREGVAARGRSIRPC